MNCDASTRRRPVYLLISIATVLAIGMVVLICSILNQAKFAYPISDKIYFRVWEVSNVSGVYTYVLTYHRGIAIGMYAEDKIVLSYTLNLKFAHDAGLNVKAVYDQDHGVVFMYDCEQKSFWVAGRVHGSDGTDLPFWVKRLEKLRERNSSIPNFLLL